MPSTLFPFISKLSNDRVKILFIYSTSNKVDKNLIEKFEKHLSTIAFKPNLDISDLDLAESDNQSKWAEYTVDISTIDIVVPLISAYFLSALQTTHNYYYSSIQQLIQLHSQHKNEMVPVLLQPVYNWQKFFGDIESLPKNNRTIKSYPDKDEAFLEVVQCLDEIVSKIIEDRYNLKTYYETFFAAIKQEYPLATDNLANLRFIREELSLRDEDIEKIESEIIRWKEGEITKQRDLEASQRVMSQTSQKLKETNQSGIFAWVLIPLIIILQLFFISRCSESADQYIQEGRNFYTNKDFEKAIEEYNRAIELDPNNFSYYNDRGNAYYFKGDFQAAIDDYTRAIDLNPENLHGYRYRGEARLRLGGYNEGAIADLKKALTLYEQDGDLQGYQSTIEILKQIQQ